MITNNGFLWIFSAGGAEVVFSLLLLGDATVDDSDDDAVVPPLRNFFLLFLRRRTAPFEFDSAAMVMEDGGVVFVFFGVSFCAQPLCI